MGPSPCAALGRRRGAGGAAGAATVLPVPRFVRLRGPEPPDRGALRFRDSPEPGALQWVAQDVTGGEAVSKPTAWARPRTGHVNRMAELVKIRAAQAVAAVTSECAEGCVEVMQITLTAAGFRGGNTELRRAVGF